MDDIKRVGGYPMVANEAYDVNDIKDLKEVDIKAWEEKLVSKNQVGLGLKNLDDPTKCKVIVISSRKRCYDSWKKYKENEYFIVL